MKLNALLLKPEDNVVTCIREVQKGDPVVFRRGEEVCSLTALEDIPYCHKAAIREIQAGEEVLKYAQVIGVAQVLLPAGSWVSHLNIQGVPRDYESELL
nr:UxaA family hydrolase [uncultured Oscillibacter sp.]